jgi:hypothetical protein
MDVPEVLKLMCMLILIDTRESPWFFYFV